MATDVHTKDIIIGVLAAYVVTDVLMSMLVKGKLPSVLEKVFELVDDSNVMIAVAAGVGAGGAIWWYLNKNDQMM